MAQVAVNVAAIQQPNPPPEAETIDAKEKWVPADITASAPDVAFTPRATQVSYRLYGGSKNNNDQIVQDWKSA